jgi:3,2-trans-enoyl-CoA isomerase
MIQKECSGKTEILKFNRGVTNAINLEFVNDLSGYLESAGEDDGVKGLVLASSNDKFFSIGLDIPELYELKRKDFAFFYKAFNRLCIDLYTLGKPTVAAITGHATAGGCILALCCDYRFIAEGKKLMGLNEAKLGVPVPYPADCMLQQIVGIRNSQEIMTVGKFYQPEVLLQLGMVNRVLPVEQVVEESILHTQSLETELGTSFEANKRERVEGVKERILEDLTAKEENFIEHWYSDKARQLLKAAIEKF